MTRRTFALLLGLTAVLLASGCSRVQLGYGQAERLLAWWLSGYIRLDNGQSSALRTQLAEFKRWHCRTQLPGYAEWLRQTGAALREDITPHQVASRYLDLRRFARLLAEDGSMRLAPLALSLGEGQTAELAREFENRNSRFRREFVDEPAAEVARARAARTRDRLEFWAGSLTRAQRDVIDRWTRALEPVHADLLHVRRQWQATLRDALEAKPPRDVMRERFLELLAEPERWYDSATVAKLAANRSRTFAMIAEVHALRTEAQARRLETRVAALAAELDGLACQAPVALGTKPAIGVVAAR